MSKIVIFGASGFVGQNIARGLSKSGHEIIAADISESKFEKIEKITYITNDILDSKNVDKIIEGAEVVIHLATSTLRTSLKDPKLNIKINVGGMMNILESCRHFGVKKVIYSSASSIYGIPEYLPVDESHPKYPTTVYGIGKYSGEHLLRVYQQLYGLNYFVLRFTNVFGPYQHPDTGGLIPVVLSKILNGDNVTIFGDGSQTRDFVYVGDIVEMVKMIIPDDHKNMIVNAGSGTNTSILEAVMKCGEVLDIQPKIEYKEQEGGERKGFQADMSLNQKLFGDSFRTSFESGLLSTSEWIKDL